jgi:hypothetical protein
MSKEQLKEDVHVVNQFGDAAVVFIESPDAGAKSTSLKLSDDENMSGGDYHSWGSNNSWPTDIRQKNESSSISFPMIAKQIGIIYGEGIEYFTEKKEDEKVTRVYSDIPEIDEFFENNNIDRLMLERLMDYKFFGNVFSEFILNKKGDKISNIYHLEAEFCRLSKQNETSKKIEKLGISSKWGDSSQTCDSDIDLLDVKNTSAEEVLQKHNKAKKFAHHSFFPSPGRTYYAVPPHHGIYKKDGWLDYSNEIPVLLNQLLKNQVTIKYHIRIPASYWSTVNSEYAGLEPAKQKEYRDEVLSNLDDFLSDKKNNFKSLVSHYITDSVTGKETSGWHIEAVDNKIKSGDWLPTTMEADNQIARAIGLDPSISGQQSSAGIGSGSGSDKRVAYNNALFMSVADEKIVLDVLQIVKKINKWPSNVKFAFRHKKHTTTDQNKSGIEE